MSFFKLVQGHLESVGSDSDAKKILDEDLEKPFAEFLNKMRLSVKLKSYTSNCLSFSLSLCVNELLLFPFLFDLLNL
ncbi:hypothetical protein LguiB_000788 [Lonicera macranthoides]